MAKLIVSGAGGRMGRLIVSIILAEHEHQLVVHLRQRVLRLSAKMLVKWREAGRSACSLRMTMRALARPDTVTLDFTSAEASLGHLEIAAANGAAICNRLDRLHTGHGSARG